MQIETITRKSDVLMVQLKDAVVGIDVEAGQYLQMAETAHATWELIDGHRTIGGIVEVLTQRYDVGNEECAAQVVEFMTTLHQHNLIEVVA